jgi:hypothetical protein
MWFAPYGLTFTEQTQANWQPSEFLGRPEPIYTYKSTSRSGSLTWKIVVDHPSALNVVVNKILSNETNKVRVDSILESFFAGCRKYDLYELAKKYYTVNPNDLYLLQEAISSKETTKEQTEYIKKTVQTGVNSPTGADVNVSQEGGGGNTNVDFKKYEQLGFYFGNDFPKKNEAIPNYTTEFTRYTSATNRQYYNTRPNAQQTNVFFDSVVIPNYNLAKEFVNDLAKQLTQYKDSDGTITVTIDASCSAPATQSYNVELAKRRIASIIKFFEESDVLKPFLSKQKLLLKATTVYGENAQVLQFDAVTKTYKIGTNVNCSDNDSNAVGGDTQVGANDITTTNAMACRRGYVKTILPTIKQPTTTPPAQYTTIVEENKVLKTVTEEVVSQEYKPRDNITKRVLRALLSECDYFETIKAETPMVYDNLRDKLKFFQPAFHSTTPEGLNSRLTFLQQCMRPGDTIPTIKDIAGKQQLQYNNATNTSFGAPPVLVLRIGDFYNTKIIPESLSLAYESLDINPEGIGIQPMIANVTLSFKFVGGSGLKESIDKLQNALTFNYYANTEIWDDRADVTAQEDFLKVLDKEFLAMASPPQAPAINQAAVENGQNNNSTIGVTLTNVISGNTETGTLSYSDFMVKFVNETQTYFQTVVNKTKESVNQYNNAVRQQWMLERSYTQGSFGVSPTKSVLFGKPSNVEKRFDTIFGELESNIQSGDEGFIKFMSSTVCNFSPKVIRQLKENYKNLVKNKRASFQNAITKITQDITTAEQTYIQTIGRANIMIFNGSTSYTTGTDGYQAKSGPVKVYVTSGTSDVHTTSTGASNTLMELDNDIRKIYDGIQEFNALIWSETEFINPSDKLTYKGVLVFETDTKGKSVDSTITVENVFKPFSKNTQFEDNIFRRVYMVVSDDVVDTKKYETFKTAMIGNIINNSGLLSGGFDDVESKFDNYWVTQTRPLFVNENNITKAFVDDVEKNKLKNYLKYTPFDKKTRVLTYTTETNASDNSKKSQKTMISSLADTTNRNTDNNRWNSEDGVSAGAYISKVKLN